MPTSSAPTFFQSSAYSELLEQRNKLDQLKEKIAENCAKLTKHIADLKQQKGLFPHGKKIATELSVAENDLIGCQNVLIQVGKYLAEIADKIREVSATDNVENKKAGI